MAEPELVVQHLMVNYISSWFHFRLLQLCDHVQAKITEVNEQREHGIMCTTKKSHRIN